MDPSESMYLVNTICRSLETQLGRDTENDAVNIISNNIGFCLSYLPKFQFLTLIQFLYIEMKGDGYQPTNFLAMF